MKTHFNYRSLVIMIFIIFLGVALSTVIVAYEFSQDVKNAKAIENPNVFGWAWSELYGWVSFNSANEGLGGSVEYGVNIDNDGNFSGYAWSSNIGWISFEGTEAPPSSEFRSNCLNACEQVAGCMACFNKDTNLVYGWAKALAFGDEGWIRLDDDDLVYLPNYGISREGIDFKGWAWGGDRGIGWLSFNCEDLADKGLGSCATDYKVTYRGDNPTVTVVYPEISFEKGFSEFLNPCASSPRVRLSWIYDSPTDTDQGSYQVIIKDSVGNPIEHKGTSAWVDGMASTFLFIRQEEDGHPKFGEAYTWTIQVKDEAGLESNIAQGTIEFYKHLFPSVNFDYLPSEPALDDLTEFFDDCSRSPEKCSQVFDGTGIVSEYLWTPAGTNGIGTSTEILLDKEQEIKLRVTDSDFYWCEKSVVLPEKSAPIWSEVKPR